eukprot:s895_g2.t1
MLGQLLHNWDRWFDLPGRCDDMTSTAINILWLGDKSRKLGQRSPVLAMASSKVGDAAATQVQIRELGLKGRWEEALNLLNSLSSSGCMVEAVTYSATMWTCVKNQQWQQALKLFKDSWMTRS